MHPDDVKQSKIERSRLTLLLGLSAAAGAGACVRPPDPGTGEYTMQQYTDNLGRERKTEPQTPGRDPAGSGTGGGDGGGGGH